MALLNIKTGNNHSKNFIKSVKKFVDISLHDVNKHIYFVDIYNLPT